MKRWGSPVSLLAMTSWQLIDGGLVLLPIALVMEGLPSAITLPNVVGFLWLGVVGTAIAYTLWFRGVGRLPVARVSLLGLLSPVVAIALGWIIAGQAMTPIQIVGLLLVLAALLIGQTGGRLARRPYLTVKAPMASTVEPR
jgi:probable blue pigment (indigoidine) exporter